MPILLVRGNRRNEGSEQSRAIHSIQPPASAETRNSGGATESGRLHFLHNSSTSTHLIHSTLSHDFLPEDHRKGRGRGTKDTCRGREVRKVGKGGIFSLGMHGLPRKLRKRSQTELQARVPWRLHQAMVQKCQHLPMLQSHCLNSWLIFTFFC